jgi:hypothetical protein
MSEEPVSGDADSRSPSPTRGGYRRRVLLAFGAACVTIQIGFGELHGKLPVVLGVAAAVAVVFWVTGLLV